MEVPTFLIIMLSVVSGSAIGTIIADVIHNRKQKPTVPAASLDMHQPPAREIWQTNYETYGGFQRHMAENGVVIPDNPQDDIVLRGMDFIALHEIHHEDGSPKSVIVQLRQKP